MSINQPSSNSEGSNMGTITDVPTQTSRPPPAVEGGHQQAGSSNESDPYVRARPQPQLQSRTPYQTQPQPLAKSSPKSQITPTQSHEEGKKPVREKIKSAFTPLLGKPVVPSTRYPITSGADDSASISTGHGNHDVNADIRRQEAEEYERGLSDEERRKREEAAKTVQRYYRGYRDRQKVSGIKMERDARWNDLVKQTGEKTYAQQQLDNKNDVVSRWHRAAQAASRLQNGEGVYNPPSGLTEDIPGDELPDKVRKARRATFWGNLSMGIGMERDENDVLPFQSKALEQQHWLEMIDGKHRYGSNMKFYFRKWKEADTQDNFFRWLDKGDGKNLDLEEMPRERFEREVITYLSAEQRLNYLVKVDKDGLLRWARTNELVDTAAGRWKDPGDGTGIVPDDSRSDDEHQVEEPKGDAGPSSSHAPKEAYATTSKTPWQGRRAATRRSGSDVSISSGSSASYSAGSGLDENEDTHYVGLDQEKEKGWLKEKKDRLTPGGIRKELLRKTVRRNTWIYVSDMNLNLFVGIKESGKFQHSSFLAGGKVTSAGIIVVKQGRVKSLNPLSGHYRSSIEHHRAFIAQLEHRGVDLSHVKMAKSILSLWGLSKYAKFTKKEQNLVSQIKKALHLKHEPTEEEKSAKLQENAEREEREHQERMKEVKAAERESGLVKDENGMSRRADGHGHGHGGDQGERDAEGGEGGRDAEDSEDEVRRIRREVLYGRKRKEEAHEQQQDTAREMRPV